MRRLILLITTLALLTPLAAAPPALPLQADDISTIRDEKTRQLTTFDVAKKSKTLHVKRGQRTTIGEVSGSGRITQMWMTFPGWFWMHWDQDHATSPTILKNLILRIYWDGSPAPAVEAPVGDFFGNGLCRTSNFTSKYFGMSSGGFFCKFPMPFRKGFRIEMENRDPAVDTEVFMNVVYQLQESVPDDAAYFHAQFRTARNPGPEPVRIVETTGTGHFVGCIVSMQGQHRNYLSFLEAPEYVYIDDDVVTPTITGTGLEDYFLGGWYFREGQFTGELHGLPHKDALDASVAMYRVHEADAIRFRKHLRFDFVNPWAPERLRPFAYSSVGFYYLDRPDGDNPPLPSTAELMCWYRIHDTDHQSIP